MRVVLVNLGTTRAPEPDAVREFLREFLSDPMVVDYPRFLWKPILEAILRRRPERVAEQYRSIWTAEGSPLEIGTRRLCQAVGLATGLEVVYAFRYGEPHLTREVSRSDDAVVVLPLFPQRTGATTGTIEKLVQSASRAHLLSISPADPGYIEALADRAQKAAQERPDHLVVSFHGLPVRYDRSEGGRYRRDCESTFRALRERLSWPEERATLAYQSLFGP